MKAQALSDDSRMSYMKGKKTLEINPRHPIIKTLKDKATEDPESEETRDLAKVLFETAMLESGFSFENPGDFAGRLFSLVRSNMGVSADEEVEPEPEEEPEEEEAAAEEEEAAAGDEEQEAPKDEL